MYSFCECEKTYAICNFIFNHYILVSLFLFGLCLAFYNLDANLILYLNLLCFCCFRFIFVRSSSVLYNHAMLLLCRQNPNFFAA